MLRHAPGVLPRQRAGHADQNPQRVVLLEDVFFQALLEGLTAGLVEHRKAAGAEALVFIEDRGEEPRVVGRLLAAQLLDALRELVPSSVVESVEGQLVDSDDAPSAFTAEPGGAGGPLAELHGEVEAAVEEVRRFTARA